MVDCLQTIAKPLVSIVCSRYHSSNGNVGLICVPLLVSSGVSIMFAFIWSPFSPFTPSCVFPSSVLQPVLPNLVFLTRGCPIAPPLAPFPFPSCESSVHSALFILLLIPYPVLSFLSDWFSSPLLPLPWLPSLFLLTPHSLPNSCL